ncbi:MAG TPA: hypothetical protein VHZ95_19205, partial [Polyangiales bacterium]|nr:hypothetical protein [Polyangiales bacterium]
TFARFPEYTERERLEQDGALGVEPLRLPSDSIAFIASGGLQRGARIRLMRIETQLTWTIENVHGRRRAWRNAAGASVVPLDVARARSEVERRFGGTSESATAINEADQWTVGRTREADFPLFRIALNDPAAHEIYLAAISGEVLQASTRAERAWTWIGAIPHWIYPAILRRQRALWSRSVIALAMFGLLVTGSGLIAGVQAAWARRRMRRRPGAVASPSVNRLLRLHQRIGLGFGLFASGWLFSGALSLTPFDWTGPDPSDAVLARIHAGIIDPKRLADLPLTAALDHCAQVLSVRELELAAFGGSLVIVCSDAAAQTRIIDLDDPTLSARRTLPVARLRAAWPAPTDMVAFELLDTADDYYYPTHAESSIAKPYLRVRVRDREQTAFYVDPARALLVAHFTARKRWERWLYHGLHSLDFPVLYRHRVVWRSVVCSAMLAGLTLSLLGLTVRRRRHWRRR